MKKTGKKASPEFLFFCGLFLMVFFIFQENLFIRLGQSLFFIILWAAGGRRFRFLPNLLMVAGITLIHLISPSGRILFSLGSWPVTLGSLERGLYKGFLLVGLIYISRVFVSPRLRFPGTAGRLLSRTFAYFEMITENRGDFNPRHPFVSLDGMLMKLSAGDPREEKNFPEGEQSRTPEDPPGILPYVFPLLLTAANGALLFLPGILEGF